MHTAFIDVKAADCGRNGNLLDDDTLRKKVITNSAKTSWR